MEKQKYQAYFAATQTVSRTKQIVLLYDGMIRFMKQGKEAIRERRIQDRYNILTKVSKIITGLQSSLDFEQGGDIAKILFDFYSQLNNRVFSIHHSNSLETCDAVIADIKKMRDAWNKIDEEMNGKSASGSAQPVDVNQNPKPDDNIILSA